MALINEFGLIPSVVPGHNKVSTAQARLQRTLQHCHSIALHLDMLHAWDCKQRWRSNGTAITPCCTSQCCMLAPANVGEAVALPSHIPLHLAIYCLLEPKTLETSAPSHPPTRNVKKFRHNPTKKTGVYIYIFYIYIYIYIYIAVTGCHIPRKNAFFQWSSLL